MGTTRTRMTIFSAFGFAFLLVTWEVFHRASDIVCPTA
jgi:hypothetical protein